MLSFFFFFKQKTAYELRISDWSSDVCSSDLIVGVSHEIRSPLNIISGYAQLIERNPTEHVEDAIKVIRRSASHLVNLVDGLLAIARYENGSLHTERNRVALPALLDHVVDMFRLQAAAKGPRSAEHTSDLPSRLRHLYADIGFKKTSYVQAQQY